MLIQHQMLKERGVYTHTPPQHMSPMHCIWLWLPSNGKVWGVTHSLSVVIGAVNLESIYWEWGNQCSKRLLQIKYLPDHGATRQCRRQEMQAWSLGREHPLGRNGDPLQDSCLDNPRDGGAWWATVHGVTKSWAWLSDWASTRVPDTALGWSLHQWWGMRWEMFRQDEPHESDGCPIKESCRMLPWGLSIGWGADIF